VVCLGSSAFILPKDLLEALVETSAVSPSASARYHDALCNVKKHLILGASEQSGGSITEAAKLLGLNTICTA